jgi:transcriptional antiterminator RfaH
MDSWYVLHTKPRNEKRVAMILEERDIQVYLPENVRTNANGLKRKTAFFPGYLFVFLSLDSVDPSLQKWTPGLRYIVAYGDQPVPIPDEVIKLIAHKLSRMELLASSSNIQFEPGDMVRIKNGPFENMLALFEGPTNPATRVQVLLSTLNRAIRVRVETDNLEKAPAHAVRPTVKRPRRTRGRGRHIN